MRQVPPPPRPPTHNHTLPSSRRVLSLSLSEIRPRPASACRPTQHARLPPGRRSLPRSSPLALMARSGPSGPARSARPAGPYLPQHRLASWNPQMTPAPVSAAMAGGAASPRRNVIAESQATSPPSRPRRRRRRRPQVGKQCRQRSRSLLALCPSQVELPALGPGRGRSRPIKAGPRLPGRPSAAGGGRPSAAGELQQGSRRAAPDPRLPEHEQTDF